MSPFDIRAALLAKHAQHVVLIHFPIALFIAGVVFDFLAQKTKKRGLAEAAYYNLLGAAIFAVPAVATGLLAWQFQLEGQKLKGILLMHLVLGLDVGGPDLDCMGTAPARETTTAGEAAGFSFGAGNGGRGDHRAYRSYRRIS